MRKIWGNIIHARAPGRVSNPPHRDPPADTLPPAGSGGGALLRGDGARYKWVRLFKGFASAKKEKQQTPDAHTTEKRGRTPDDGSDRRASMPVPGALPEKGALQGDAGQIASSSIRGRPGECVAGAMRNAVELMRHPAGTQQMVQNTGPELKRILCAYDPEVLKDSPIVDRTGKPLRLALGAGPKRTANEGYLPGKLDEQVRVDEVAAWISSYKEKRAWQDRHMHVKTIVASDVPGHEQALVGQEGVFCMERMEKGAIVGPFGGMILDDAAEYRYRQLCEAAGMDSDRYSFDASASGNADRKLIGLSMLMKANAALLETPERRGRFFFNEHDAQRNNISLFFMEVHDKEGGQKIALGFFHANRDIEPGEQICYRYGSKNTLCDD